MATGSPHVLILLIGEVLEDPRVLKTCRSLVAEGARVSVGCTNSSNRPPREHAEGLDIRRFPHRTEYWLKTAAIRLMGAVRRDTGERVVGHAQEAPHGSTVRAAAQNIALKLNARHYLRESWRIEELMVRAYAGMKFDLIHVNDVDTLRAGAALKSAGAGRSLLYDSHEYWPGIAGWRNEGLIAEEAAHIGAADYVVTVNAMIADMLQRDYHLKQTPASVMNCPYRTDMKHPPDTIGDPVRVVYQGKLQAYRGLFELVTAFREVPGATLTMSGYGPLEEPLRRLVTDSDLNDRVQFTGRYGPFDTMDILAGHDIGVLPFPSTTVSITYCAPNKLFDYAMGGLAICASDLPFLSQAVSEHDMGRVFPHSEPAGIAHALNDMIADTAALRRFRANARAAASTTFCWEEQWRQYPWHP